MQQGEFLLDIKYEIIYVKRRTETTGIRISFQRKAW